MCMSPVSIRVPKTNLPIFTKAQEYIEIPCGKCDECRCSHARQWAVRCMCEFFSRSKEEQDRSWFITLTYDDEHNPLICDKKHMPKFIKAVRKKYKNYRMKYFYCGEYGSISYRPHYHMIIYNLPIDDLVPIGNSLFTSKTLEQIWGKGIISIGQVSLQSCNYVARYAIKKNTSDCYIRMSYGFGKKYFLDHMEDIVSNNFITLPKGDKIMKCAIPRYFMKIYRSKIGEYEYGRWLKWRLQKIHVFNEKVEKFYSKAVNKLDYLTRRRLGIRSEAVKLNQKSRDLLRESYYEFAKVRDII